MKTTALIVVLLSALAYAESGGGSDSTSSGGDTVGSHPSLEGGDVKLTPGTDWENDDGVGACNDDDSDGDVIMNPATGNADSATTVTTTPGFSGCVSGLDDNDTVNMGCGNDVTISGGGGTINMGGDSTASITNTGPGIMTVNANGTTIGLSPGSHMTITTPPSNLEYLDPWPDFTPTQLDLDWLDDRITNKDWSQWGITVNEAIADQFGLKHVPVVTPEETTEITKLPPPPV